MTPQTTGGEGSSAVNDATQAATTPDNEGEPAGPAGQTTLTPDDIRRMIEALVKVRAQESPGDGFARPIVVAVDGRSTAGKTTLATALCDAPGWACISTDDVAWWHSFFNWSQILIDGVLKPARRGANVSFRPDAWIERGRPGSITVSRGTSYLVIEGVGASREELQPYLDYAIWIRTNPETIEEREAGRARNGESTTAFQEEWMQEEIPFIQQDQPWARANFIVTAHPQPGSYEILADAASNR